MTPRTRSLYAYMGESQQPYQSPSKDLDMLNGRISGPLPRVVEMQVTLFPARVILHVHIMGHDVGAYCLAHWGIIVWCHVA